jgi:predicted NBD/HSP70 family sugar kinase
MMIKAGGIDLGGTKIEAQMFDADWNVAQKRRTKTPKTYPELVNALVDQVHWLRHENAELPVGIAAAGFANQKTGDWVAANLAADGKPFVRDVEQATKGKLTWLNDCRAFTQAEATFGAGRSDGTMVGLVLGTGVAGGVAIDGDLINGGAGQSGEFGHMPISGAILSAYHLPALTCGCGRKGCYETYGSGPGMERLANHLTGCDLSAREIVNRRNEEVISKVWSAWCEINASMIFTIMTTIDPKAIVLGGGLSQIPGLIESLNKSLKQIAWPAFPLPAIRLGTRGETAAALGAAYAAWHV